MERARNSVGELALKGNASSDITTTISPEGKKFAYHFMTEGVIVLLGTAAAYTGSYFYELGYANYYNIPSELITVSVQSIVIFAATLILLSNSFYVTIEWFVRRCNSDLPEHAGIPKLILRKWSFLLVLAFLIWLATVDWRIAGGSLLLPPLLFLLDTFPIMSSRGRNGQTYLDALKAHLCHVDPIEESLNTSNSKIKALFYVSLFMLILCLFKGWGDAKSRNTFTFLENSPEAILRRYGDTFVVGRFDPKSGKLLAEFRLAKIDDVKNRLVVRRIGTVSPVRVGWRADTKLGTLIGDTSQASIAGEPKVSRARDYNEHATKK